MLSSQRSMDSFSKSRLVVEMRTYISQQNVARR